MCKGCAASELTISLLRSQLARETERADKYEKILFSFAGITNESLPTELTEIKPVPGRTTWNMIRRKLEAADRKKLDEMNKHAVPEGQEL
jgi:hypothetical protein